MACVKRRVRANRPERPARLPLPAPVCYHREDA